MKALHIAGAQQAKAAKLDATITANLKEFGYGR